MTKSVRLDLLPFYDPDATLAVQRSQSAGVGLRDALRDAYAENDALREALRKVVSAYGPVNPSRKARAVLDDRNCALRDARAALGES